MTNFMIFEDGGLRKQPFSEDVETLQGLVGGYIEHVMIPDLADRGIDLWVNDEGKLIGLTPTIGLIHDDELIDVLNGTVVFTRFGTEGETFGLTDEDCDFIKDYIRTLEMRLILYGGDIALIPCMEL